MLHSARCHDSDAADYVICSDSYTTITGLTILGLGLLGVLITLIGGGRAIHRDERRSVWVIVPWVIAVVQFVAGLTAAT